MINGIRTVILWSDNQPLYHLRHGHNFQSHGETQKLSC